MKCRVFIIALFLSLGFGAKAQSLVDCKENIPVDFLIPNVITPNSDGKNDEFKVVSANLIKLHVEIFDRWGIKVYTLNGTKDIWDGTAYGVLQSSGTYYYSAEYSTTCAPAVVMKTGGYFTLLRPN